MLTLTYGYSKPQLDDTGDIFFPALEADIQQLNDHNHNGSNSAILAPSIQNILAAGWASVTGKINSYSQVVTMPSGYLYDAVALSFRLSTGQAVYPAIDRTSASSFTVYTNDNTLAYIVEYGI